MRYIILSIVIFFLMGLSTTLAQSIPELNKRSILRIETPEQGLGTGFLVRDSLLGFFLVTNKHMVQSPKTHQYFDSVFVRRNKISDDNKVVATNEKATLYLRWKGSKLFAEHPDSNVDLVIVIVGAVPLGDTVIVNPANYDPWIYGIKMDMVAKREDIKRLDIRDGTPVQIIGFSFATDQEPQFHISRFGNIAIFPSDKLTLNVTKQRANCECTEPITSEWIILDITSRPGDSGGPVFALLPGSNQAWLVVGLVAMGHTWNELCLAHPSYYIWELVDLIKQKIKSQSIKK